MQGICLQNQVTRSMLDQVPVPVHTRSYRPMPYGEIVDYTREQAINRLGLELESETYGLNRIGDQFFGLLTFKTDSAEQGLSIGLRSSYNKTISPGVAMGSQVFVCDNLMFSGNAFKIVRKNTTNVDRDFRRLVSGNIGDSLKHYDQIQDHTKQLKAAPCNERRGYGMLGVAMGEGVLTPTQASVAFQDWKTPRHIEFSDRNLWGLYNCITEGLKKGPVGRTMDRHARAHDFMADMAIL